MILKQLNQHIRRAFSSSAIEYEVLASMQYEIGRELIKVLESLEDCGAVLDVGMGTGKLTNRIYSSCPVQKIVGMDIAEGMVQEAKRKYETFFIVQGQAEHLPFGERSFDAVVSNAAYQWVEDLENSFAEVKRVLKDDGIFCATVFGQETLTELFESLKSVSGDQQIAEWKRLPPLSRIQKALSLAGFQNVRLRSEMNRTHFEDCLSLLRWLKSIGANRLNPDYFLGPRRMKRMMEHYQQHYNGRWGIMASFEVIWIEARC